MLDMPLNPTKPNLIYLISIYEEDAIKSYKTKSYILYIYMYEDDLGLNNQ